jgi:hypothetical protein
MIYNRSPFNQRQPAPRLPRARVNPTQLPPFPLSSVMVEKVRDRLIGIKHSTITVTLHSWRSRCMIHHHSYSNIISMSLCLSHQRVANTQELTHLELALFPVLELNLTQLRRSLHKYVGTPFSDTFGNSNLTVLSSPCR